MQSKKQTSVAKTSWDADESRDDTLIYEVQFISGTTDVKALLMELIACRTRAEYGH